MKKWHSVSYLDMVVRIYCEEGFLQSLNNDKIFILEVGLV